MHPKPKRKIDPELLKTFRDQPCAGCGQGPCDAAHIRSRGAHGDDDEMNLLPLCRSCHQFQHAHGFYAFSLKFPAVKKVLSSKNWVFDVKTNKLTKK